MFKFSHIQDVAGWFQEYGPEYDVVLSSRMRLSRNLSGHLFPGTMGNSEEQAVQKEILSAFDKIPGRNRYTPVMLKDLQPTERKMLLERHILSQGYSLKTERAVILGENQYFSGMINETDHLRLSCIKGGLSLGDAYNDVARCDSQLEKHIDFAVSLDLGYLNTEVTNVGTGLRASVMLHLPALVKTSLIEKAFKAVVQVGLSVKGFFGDDDHSLGNMYQISNQISLGLNEKEIQEKLENITRQIVNYERKAREDLLEKRRVEIEDEVFRAYGILTNCRTLSSREAIELISGLRLGVSLGIMDFPLERITAALFLTQKAHIQQAIQSQETGADTTLIDYTRAQLVQESLEKSTAA